MPSVSVRAWTLARVVFVFGAAGPPIGALTLAAAIFIGSLFASGQGVEFATYVLVPGLLISYVAGGVQALLAGALVGAIVASGRKCPWWMACIIATGLGLMHMARLHVMVAPDWLMQVAVWLPVHLVPTLACWRIVSRLPTHTTVRDQS